jgi:hypothetical protein
MKRRLSLALALLAGCGTLDHPDASNLAAYCTPQNAYRLGSQYRAYFGDCPKESEPQFLAGLRRGRAIRPYTPLIVPYYDVNDQPVGRLLAASSDAERAPLRARLRDLEWWTIHLMNDHATFHH